MRYSIGQSVRIIKGLPNGRYDDDWSREDSKRISWQMVGIVVKIKEEINREDTPTKFYWIEGNYIVDEYAIEQLVELEDISYLVGVRI